jgi:FkbM family methyltransferase
MGALHKSRLLRRLALPLLKQFNPGAITIRHHWTGDPFVLDAFRHKGYWFHRNRRELDTMQRFAELVSPGDTILDVGGHIGYMSVYFAHLVSPAGRVVVFEPGPNNLPFLRSNAKRHAQVQVVEQAVSDAVGSATFHIENLTGQNNSLLEDYHRMEENKRVAYTRSQESCIEVRCTTLDAFLAEQPPLRVSLVKVDVEGAELKVLRGMPRLLAGDIVLMVEVTHEHDRVCALLRQHGFLLFDPRRTPIPPGSFASGNVFCVKPSDARIRFLSTPTAALAGPAAVGAC